MLWTTGVAELLRWRRERKAAAEAVAQLIVEVEAFLAEQPVPPRRANEPPVS